MSGKRISFFTGLLILATILLFIPLLEASDLNLKQPGNAYHSAYNFYWEAERLFYQEDLESALDKYKEAEKILEALKANHPGWRTGGIDHKLKSCQKRIKAIEETISEKKAWEHPLKVHFLDVGFGDCALIQCPNGANILIDGGWSDYSYSVINYLQKAGVKKIDLMVATHPHADHIGNLAEVLGSFKVDTVLDSGKTHTTQNYQGFLETLKASLGTKFKLGRAGDSYRFGDVELLILHPSSRLPQKINDCSIVIKLNYGDESFLFTGDAEKQAEQELMSRGYSLLRSKVLKLGHHGSNTSTSPSFLSAVSPREAVNSRNGPPAKEVLRRIRSRGIKLYRTDLQGTIVFLSNGREHQIESLASRPNYK